MIPSIAVCALVPEDDIIAKALIVEDVVVDDPNQAALILLAYEKGASG